MRKRIVVLLLILLLGTIMTASAANPPQYIDGILGFTWNMSPAETEKIANQQSYQESFSRQTDRLEDIIYNGSFEGEKADIICSFIDKQLYLVVISIPETKSNVQDTFEDKKNNIIKNYGLPLANFPTSTWWNASSSSGKISSILLYYNEKKPEIVYCYMNKQLYDEASVYRKKIQKKYF